MTAVAASRLRPADLPALATVGIRTRRMRSALTALGIAIGIGALVAVLGIASSTKAELDARLAALGTNRLEVAPGQSLVGENVTLPPTAAARIRRLPAVTGAAAASRVEAVVRRNPLVPRTNTSGISVNATDLQLLDTVGATVASGRWLDPATARLPAVVLGSTAARRLGIGSPAGRQVLIDDQPFTVIGILAPVPLYASLDSGAFIGFPVAAERFAANGNPNSVFITVQPASIDTVRGLLAATVNPIRPADVKVSRPSDAVAAQRTVSSTLTALLLGLGGVALLVGGIGVANVMVIGVMERRTEIGVRRALGATRRHIRLQFLSEASLLGLGGGLMGVALGAAVTGGYTVVRHVTFSLPPSVVLAGGATALLIGAAAGLSPAARAARLAPADAIRPV